MSISPRDVGEEVSAFLDSACPEDEVVVGILRFGAHLPHIYQRFAKMQRPMKLLLSNMIGFLPRDYFRGKRLLLLDDTVYQGVELCDWRTRALDEIGLHPEQVHTAAPIVHERSKWVPDRFARKLSHTDYVAWKESLVSLVREDIRPAGRDQPLYFFRLRGVSLGWLISTLKEIGRVSVIGDDWIDPVLRLAVTFDKSLICDALQPHALDSGSISKVRFYVSQCDGELLLTVVPMVFVELDLKNFHKENHRKLARDLSMEETFFERVRDCGAPDASGRMLFYFVSRSVALLVLRRVIQHLSDRLVMSGASLQFVDPDEVDHPISYVFPNEYVEFYDRAERLIRSTLLAQPSGELPFGGDRALPVASFDGPEKSDLLIPAHFQILQGLVEHTPPAVKADGHWQPNRAPDAGCAFSVLDRHYRDGVFLSKALDELFDAGLMRAFDGAVLSRPTVYARLFSPGGEYNAVQIARLVDSWSQGVCNIQPEFIEEAGRDLWGDL